MRRNKGKVSYRQNLVDRAQLLEMRKTLLNKCEEVMDRTNWPFKKKNLKPEKVFNDLMEYHNGEFSTRDNLNLTLINESSALQSKNALSKAGFGRKGSHQLR